MIAFSLDGKIRGITRDNAGNYNSTSATFKIKPLPAIIEISPKTLNIKKFIEVVYNKKRIHSSIGYITPEEFEKSEGRF